MSRPRSLRRIGAALALASMATLALGACGSDPTEGAAAPSDTIVVGSAAFPENEIIAEIYAQALEAKGVQVSTKLQIGAREAYIPALEKGEIDLLPEYTGNLLAYVDPEATATSADDVAAALPKALPEGLEVLDVSKAEDKDSLNVTKATADKYGLSTIADLSKLPQISLGAQPEFRTRSYGVPGLEKVYGLEGIDFTSISDGGGPTTLKALLDGKINVADIYSTTPSILENDLVTLEDPESLIAAQNVVPLINSDKASDEVTEVLNEISAKLTTQDLLEMNSKNQGADKAEPAVLAKQWLTDNGLI